MGTNVLAAIYPFFFFFFCARFQDPYHGTYTEPHTRRETPLAMGLAFSVPAGAPLPPSLENIYRELMRDPEVPAFDRMPSHGDLTSWARQGVVLLNTVLTVRAHSARSHVAKRWEAVTDRIIRHLSAYGASLVFMLWGGDARRKAHLIDRDKHLVLGSAHPSPLSARYGFEGNGHFSAANRYLIQHTTEPIDWATVLTDMDTPPVAAGGSHSAEEELGHAAPPTGTSP